MNRGDRRQAIFADDLERQRLLETITEAWQRTGCQAYGHCLMRNHLHLVNKFPNATRLLE
jgi:REP element-mobilizing transposase RayT